MIDDVIRTAIRQFSYQREISVELLTLLWKHCEKKHGDNDDAVQIAYDTALWVIRTAA